jgi:hypothetical protein
MGAPISLFSGYSQGENRTTNYCLLVLKMFYEENPKLLGEVLSELISEQAADLVGVRFLQQMKKEQSIPDGLIFQRAFTVYIETKHFDWFYDSQIEAHLESLQKENGIRVLLALGTFEGDTVDRFKKIEKLCAEKYRNKIFFSAVSFEELLDALGAVEPSKNLRDTIDDFRAYLDEEGLLPDWRDKLDVVNCATMTHEITGGGVYLCPATGGNYNHQRARYFGMYRQRCVEQIAEIRAVVDLTAPGASMVRWNNTAGKELVADLISLAEQKMKLYRFNLYPLRCFILGPLYATEFRKDTKHGMRTSKQYFDVKELNIGSAEELALALKGKEWRDLR